MKIVEPQSAVLSNGEVLSFLSSRPARRAMKSPNYEAIVKELTDYLSSGSPYNTGISSSSTTTAPAEASGGSPPASSSPPAPAPAVAGRSSSATPQKASPDSPLPPYSSYPPEAIRTLLRRLEQYKLSQAELLMTLNLRPRNLELLDAVVEECDDRLGGEMEQLGLLKIVGEVLGTGPDDLGGEGR